MAGPWVTTVDVKGRLTDMLSVGTLVPRWDSIIGDAISDGYRDLRTRLISRGYTEGQLDAWDDRISYNRDQALFWCFVKGAGLGGYSDQDYSKLDHRKELENPELGISIGGTIVLPGAAADVGSVIVGTLVIDAGPDENSTYRTQSDRREIWGSGGLNEYGPWIQ
jgi:hypothetical protein